MSASSSVAAAEARIAELRVQLLQAELKKAEADASAMKAMAEMQIDSAAAQCLPVLPKQPPPPMRMLTHRADETAAASVPMDVDEAGGLKGKAHRCEDCKIPLFRSEAWIGDVGGHDWRYGLMCLCYTCSDVLNGTSPPPCLPDQRTAKKVLEKVPS